MIAIIEMFFLLVATAAQVIFKGLNGIFLHNTLFTEKTGNHDELGFSCNQVWPLFGDFNFLHQDLLLFKEIATSK